MAASTDPISPYDMPRIEEVPLDARNLARVICQVRFPSLTMLVGPKGTETAERVANLLAETYPLFDARREGSFFVSPEGVQTVLNDGTDVWRLRSADEVWQVSFAKEFVSVECKKYTSRTDFLRRTTDVMAAFAEVITAPVIRIGMRYTNVITDEAVVSDLPTYVKRELLGGQSDPSKADVQLANSVSQIQYVEQDGGLNVIVGVLAPGQSIDVTLVPSLGRSWILDIDSYTTQRLDFDAALIAQHASDRAKLAYSSFRWSVTDTFLSLYRER